jgi:hypothetical protein
MIEWTTDFLTRGDAPDDLVQVDVGEGLTTTEVIEVDEQWEGPMLSLVAELTNTGVNSSNLPVSWGWSWENILKTEQQPEWRVIGIRYADKWQGIAIIDTFSHPIVSDGDDALGVYLAYIATAPWNLGYYLQQVDKVPLFDDVGHVLLSLAVRKSIEKGLEGRLVLHAVAGSEEFYRKCGITELGPEEMHPSRCIRFEVSADQGRILLGEEK